MRNKFKHNYSLSSPRTGFTLIEFLIYSVIVAFLIGSLVLSGINILQGRARASVMEDVNYNGRIAIDRITSHIRASEGINSPSIGGSSDYLSLQFSGRTVIFDLDEDNILQIKVGLEDAIPLISEKTEVVNLDFINTSQSTSTPAVIKIEMTLKYRNLSGRQEYDFQRKFQTTETAKII